MMSEMLDLLADSKFQNQCDVMLIIIDVDHNSDNNNSSNSGDVVKVIIVIDLNFISSIKL